MIFDLVRQSDEVLWSKPSDFLAPMDVAVLALLFNAESARVVEVVGGSEPSCTYVSRMPQGIGADPTPP